MSSVLEDTPDIDTAEAVTPQSISPENAHRLAHRAGLMPKSGELHAIGGPTKSEKDPKAAAAAKIIQERREALIAAFLFAEYGFIVDPQAPEKVLSEEELDRAAIHSVRKELIVP